MLLGYLNVHTLALVDTVVESVRAQASCVEGQEFESRPSPTNDLQNYHLLLQRLVLGITRIGLGLIS